MSQPSFPNIDPPLTRDDVINQVISSVAMEELGLSHIINAEGEKIQYALGTLEGATGPAEPATLDELLDLNKSVRDTLDAALQNQMVLKSKFQVALSTPTRQESANGLNAFASIYSNVERSTSGKANIPIIIQLPFSTSSKNVSFATPNSITVIEAGTYYITYEMLASFDVSATATMAVRSNGTNIKMTETTITLGALAPVYYSGTSIVNFPAGAVIDMIVTSDVDVTMSFDATSIQGINIFKLD